MASMNKDEFIAMVEGMTVLELHEIVKALEDRFGVTAAAPAAAAAAPGAAAPVAEEKTEFDVILTGFGANKIQVIKEDRGSPAWASRKRRTWSRAFPSRSRKRSPRRMPRG